MLAPRLAAARGGLHRLINVTVGRARECAAILCSRAEMNKFYLLPQRSLLSIQVLRKRGRKLSWEGFSLNAEFVPAGVHEDREKSVAETTHTLGGQFNPTPTVRRSSVGLAVGASGRIPFRFRNSSLRQQVLHDVTMHIRQPKIAARMVICQAFVV